MVAILAAIKGGRPANWFQALNITVRDSQLPDGCIIPGGMSVERSENGYSTGAIERIKLMEEGKVPQPTQQRQVDFYGDELTAVRLEDGSVYVSVRHMCEALGLAQRGQVLRIKRNDILAEGYEGGIVMITPGGRQRVGMIRVDLIPLWLSGVTVNRVKEEIRPKLQRFQREAAKVLWEAFQEGRLTTDPTFDDLMAQDTPESRAVRMAEAVLQLARNQLMMRSQIEEYGRRLESIESQLGDPGRKISSAQATNISQAVKAVAMALSKASGRNEYGGVYGELYRRYEIPGYRELPAGKYEDAIGWLNEWLQSITGDSPF